MRKHLKNEDWTLDAIDSQLLDLLNDNARMPVAELAREVKMSSPSVNERLRRMEEFGVISGYRVQLAPENLGFPLEAIVRMRQLPGKIKQLEAMIIETPEFIECDKVTGEDCFYARMRFGTMEQLDEILDKVSSLAETNTSIVKSTPVKRRNVPYQYSRRYNEQ